VIDSRIRELTEYFNIPATRFDHNFPAPFDIYQQTDYGKFNKSIVEKYAVFKKFMDQCGINIKPCGMDVPDFKPHTISREDKELITYQAKICPSDRHLFKRDTDKLGKKVVFVAHEFGLYPGHGGIAAYLYNICKYLLEHTNFSVHVVTDVYDKNCDLLPFENFTIWDNSHGDLGTKRDKVLNICEKIQPDYVELADFQALGLHLVLHKSHGTHFQDTVIVTNNHTATRECFEWSASEDILIAPPEMQFCFFQEALQMKYSDYCIAPSSFLAKYVKKNYGLSNDVLVFANPLLKRLKTKEEIIGDVEDKIDLEPYKDSFNIALITRFEGRKNQIRLIESFEKVLNRHEHCRLFLAGNTSFWPDGEDYRFQVFECTNLHLRDRIHFFDFMTLKDQEKIWALTDLTIMPSTFENQPMAMIEAVMRGIPAMGSRYSGIADYSAAEMLFDPFDEDSLYLAISNFIEKTKEERKQLQTMQRAKLECFINPEISILPRFRLEPQQRGKDYYRLRLSDKYQ
jgi:glycosyltransferase involved in cell wall biosynthesis